MAFCIKGVAKRVLQNVAHRSKQDVFMKEFESDNIDEFCVVQDCNMHSSYWRCFYKLKNHKDKVYQEVPFRLGSKFVSADDDDYDMWKEPVFRMSSKDQAFFDQTDARFNRTASRCRYDYTLKSVYSGISVQTPVDEAPANDSVMADAAPVAVVKHKEIVETQQPMARNEREFVRRVQEEQQRVQEEYQRVLDQLILDNKRQEDKENEENLAIAWRWVDIHTNRRLFGTSRVNLVKLTARAPKTCLANCHIRVTDDDTQMAVGISIDAVYELLEPDNHLRHDFFIIKDSPAANCSKELQHSIDECDSCQNKSPMRETGPTGTKARCVDVNNSACLVLPHCDELELQLLGALFGEAEPVAHTLVQFMKHNQLVAEDIQEMCKKMHIEHYYLAAHLYGNEAMELPAKPHVQAKCTSKIDALGFVQWLDVKEGEQPLKKAIELVWLANEDNMLVRHPKWIPPHLSAEYATNAEEDDEKMHDEEHTQQENKVVEIKSQEDPVMETTTALSQIQIQDKFSVSGIKRKKPLGLLAHVPLSWFKPMTLHRAYKLLMSANKPEFPLELHFFRYHWLKLTQDAVKTPGSCIVGMWLQRSAIYLHLADRSYRYKLRTVIQLVAGCKNVGQVRILYSRHPDIVKYSDFRVHFFSALACIANIFEWLEFETKVNYQYDVTPLEQLEIRRQALVCGIAAGNIEMLELIDFIGQDLTEAQRAEMVSDEALTKLLVTSVSNNSLHVLKRLQTRFGLQKSTTLLVEWQTLQLERHGRAFIEKISLWCWRLIGLNRQLVSKYAQDFLYVGLDEIYFPKPQKTLPDENFNKLQFNYEGLTILSMVCESLCSQGNLNNEVSTMRQELVMNSDPKAQEFLHGLERIYPVEQERFEVSRWMLDIIRETKDPDRMMLIITRALSIQLIFKQCPEIEHYCMNEARAIDAQLFLRLFSKGNLLEHDDSHVNLPQSTEEQVIQALLQCDSTLKRSDAEKQVKEPIKVSVAESSAEYDKEFDELARLKHLNNATAGLTGVMPDLVIQEEAAFVDYQSPPDIGCFADIPLLQKQMLGISD